MYGQGNNAPQVHPGPPPPPPPPYQRAAPVSVHPFQQVLPALPPAQAAPQIPPPPNSHQAPIGPSLLPYQHVQHAGLQSSPLSHSLVNMGQPYLQTAQPMHGLTLMYPHLHPSYPPPIASQNVCYPIHAMPVPTVLPSPPPPQLPPPPPPQLPPPPPSSQGQVFYRPPHLCSPEICAPNPPLQSSFVPITPLSFVSSGQNHIEDSVPPSLPPPPPSSPPPLPPSPPPPSSPKADMLTDVLRGLPNAFMEEPLECDASSSPPEPAHVTDNMSVQVRLLHGELGMFQKNVSLASDAEKIFPLEGEIFKGLPSTPPRPENEKVVKNIEVLCQYIANLGSRFENVVREREANNPEFSFLFGGEPGSSAAIAHEYFQWKKWKYEPNKQSFKEHAHAPHSDQQGAISPADSDMDTEDADNSPFIEDLSPVRASGGAAECRLEENAVAFIRSSTGESPLVGMVAPVAAGGKLVKNQAVSLKEGSPFRLIRDYSSDESSEDNKKEYPAEATHLVGGSTASEGISGLLRAQPKEGAHFDEFPQKSMSCNHVQDSPTDVVTRDLEQGFDQQDDKIASGVTGIIHHSDIDGFGPGISPCVAEGKSELAEHNESLEVDEFGRLMRKDASDSDSDRMYSHKTHDKRGRSQSRSLSPRGNRWRCGGRSPRRGRRSRSRSWSPRRRIRSPPAFRRTNGFARRGKDQPRQCFNFIRGRCFRGANCRFLHRDIGRLKSKRQVVQDAPQEPRHYKGHRHRNNLIVTEGDADQRNGVPREEVKGSEMQGSQKRSSPSTKPIRDGMLDDSIQASVNDASHLYICEQPSDEEAARVCKSPIKKKLQQSPFEVGGRSGHAFQLNDSIQAQQDDGLLIRCSPSVVTQSSPNETPEQYLGEGSASHPSQASPAYHTVDEVDNPPKFSHGGGQLSDHAPVQGSQSSTFQDQRPDVQSLMTCAPPSQAYPRQSPASQPYATHVCQPHPSHVPPNEPPIQPISPKDFPPSSFAVTNIHLPFKQPHPAPQGHTSLCPPGILVGAPFAGQPQENLVPPATGFQVHSSSKDTCPHPPQHAWSSFPPHPPPPPPSHVHELPPVPCMPGKVLFPPMHSTSIPSRDEFNPQPPLRPCASGELAHPQAVDHHQASHITESSHHLHPHRDIVLERSLPDGQQQMQPCLKKEYFSHPPIPQVPQFNLNNQRGYNMGHQTFPREEDRGTSSGQWFAPSTSDPQVNNMQSQALSLPYSHFHVVYKEHTPASASFSSEVEPSFLQCSSGLQDKTYQHHLADPSMTKFSSSTFYNPYSSTFRHPPSSLKFGPDVFTHESETSYSNKYTTSSNHVSVGGPESRITISPLNCRTMVEPFLHSESAKMPVEPPEGSTFFTYGYKNSAEVRAGVQKQFVRAPSAGDPYDPLFDSIEPSSTLLKFSSLHRPEDVEENNRQKGALAATVKSDIDELGEVATDADGGAVENDSPQIDFGEDWRPSIPIDVENAPPGEVEIDQLKSPGKKKKDSRSMKLFRIALADFVKEVLKPSWRQGNMSKEAFKTIVKKTVDKVSGAMANRRIPRSQAKINQYVESSERKLTKLVMGYVDKYVKT